ncbi:MAG: hypothetical protein K0R78_3291 [Pelosinus sp.]|jgi:hypothetical protein|nr:hypothetical protein [Pelosinus sp.]
MEHNYKGVKLGIIWILVSLKWYVMERFQWYVLEQENAYEACKFKELHFSSIFT